MESDTQLHRRAVRLGRRSDRRALQVGNRDQLQQQVDRLAAQELQPHLRRSRHGARHLHPSVLDRHYGQAARHRRRDHRHGRQQPRHRPRGFQTQSGDPHHLDDGHRGFLRAHGRLALQHGTARQNGCRRRHHGRRAGSDGRCGLRPAAGRRGQLGQSAESPRLHRHATQPQHLFTAPLRDGGT